MDTLKRSSLDDLGLAQAGSRRWSLVSGRIRSPTSSTGSASVSSLDGDGQAACVARDSPTHDCAVHRFLVWVAFRRNHCHFFMTAEQRTQCPMAGCRRPCRDHEDMLQHLAVCVHLASGEYYCHSCGRVEQFADARGRRCLGHASRRRRVISMAKTFFTSLGGHRAKQPRALAAGLDLPVGPAAGLDLPVDPAAAELDVGQIRQIHEMESNEPGQHYECYLSVPAPTPPTTTTTTTTTSGPSRSAFDESLIIDWSPEATPTPPPPPPYLPILPSPPSPPPPPPPPAVSNAYLGQDLAKTPDRPVLQLNTRVDSGQARQACRSREELTPSLSVRSTPSTTPSSASNISPLSAWSGIWSRPPESTLTSPADDQTNLADLLPPTSHPRPWRGTESRDIDLSGLADSSLPSELPAELPMLDLLSVNDPGQDDLLPAQPTLALHVPAAPVIPIVPSAEPTPAPTGARHSARLVADASALAQSARKLLEIHVGVSLDRLGYGGDNHLARQLCGLSVESVADAGLETMADMLEGRTPASAVGLLCFVHVAYALSILIHEQGAISRSADLFAQAMSYRSCLSHPDGSAYAQVVGLLWKPSDVAGGHGADALRPPPAAAAWSPSQSQPTWREGGRRAPASGEKRPDPLVLVAQHFLDELEASAVRETRQPQVLASGLCDEHRRDSPAHGGALVVALAVDDTMLPLAQRYGPVPGLALAIQQIWDRVKADPAARPRRLELDLLQAGKAHLPWDVYIDEYVQLVRGRVDALYGPGANPRLRFYRHGIRLLGQLMAQRPEADKSVFATWTTDDITLDSLAADWAGSGLGSLACAELFMPTGVAVPDAAAVAKAPVPGIAVHPPPPEDEAPWLPTAAPVQAAASPGASTSDRPRASTKDGPATTQRMACDSCCGICGYRPMGNPRWFVGSMAKHKKNKHGSGPPQVYRCPYPGCTSEYKSRRDNLRQHQIDKSHFVEGDEGAGRRPRKRKRTE
ncbi:hypothetical protein CDD83_1095 [Cordyceps sp. RAO-2017]|nr:hypothetical protein CDD83_1095 [Cordyceps sp. RAO-2017]